MLRPIGVAHHTWQFTASAGTGIGHRGMLYAAKTLAEAGWRLASDEGLVERTKEDFLSGRPGKIDPPRVFQKTPQRRGKAK